MSKVEYGAFCEMYGKTLRNLILEFILVRQSVDFSVGDLSEEVGVSRPKAYQEVYALEGQGLVKRSRIVSGTQLWRLNNEDVIVKKLKKDLMFCLKRVVEKHKLKGKGKSIKNIKLSGRTKINAL